MIKEEEIGGSCGTRGRVLVGNTVGKRPLGRPRSRLEDNIGMMFQVRCAAKYYLKVSMIFMGELSFRFHAKDLMTKPYLMVTNTKAYGTNLTCLRSVVKLHLINSRENKKYLRNFD